MTGDDGAAAPTISATRSSEWLELFFDLVVVAAVAVIIDGLVEHPTSVGLGLAALTYGGVWAAWASVVLYTNLAEGAVRTRTVVAAMFLLAVMAATAPGPTAPHPNLFGGAYLLVRWISGKSSIRTGRIDASWWPVVRLAAISMPVLLGMLLQPPAKWWCWAGALALELASILAGRGLNKDDGMARLRRSPNVLIGRGKTNVRRVSKPFKTLDLDTAHLDERMGLFVIIVLGEVVAELVFAASHRQ